MSFFPKGFSPPVTSKNIAYLHILLKKCSDLYPFSKDELKNKLKSNLNIEHISDINFDQYNEAKTTLINAILAKNPNYLNY